MFEGKRAKAGSFEAYFPDSSDDKESACSAGDPGSIPGSGRSPGEGNGNSLQYSCLENLMDGRQATVSGVAKSQTRLSHFTSLHLCFNATLWPHWEHSNRLKTPENKNNHQNKHLLETTIYFLRAEATGEEKAILLRTLKTFSLKIPILIKNMEGICPLLRADS